ncbi:hypothetical protein CP532_3457 [Ophiocordyceps camponoti-leonardi (nom. inval.)]|nr:hypothetical protein CP532_3457 [Ophiocordyceps camponoti-leonardi (nom. inval.)]
MWLVTLASLPRKRRQSGSDPQGRHGGPHEQDHQEPQWPMDDGETRARRPVPDSRIRTNDSRSVQQSKKLSDSMEPGLALQGIGFFVRKGICMATITLSVEQYEGTPRPPSTAEGPVWRIDSTQSAAGLSSTSEQRCVDDTPREQTDWVFGTVEGRSHWITVDEVDDAYLAGGWIFDGDDKTLLRAIAVNKTAGWTATQVWGFQMVDDERRYCRNVVIEKGDERVNFRIVYDYVG